jgi:trimeric autotransporter adhesin
MKSSCLIFTLLACGIASVASAQTATVRAVRAVQRPRVSPVATQLYVTTTAAGTGGSAGSSGDGGPAKAALLSNPIAVVVDPQGNYFISDYQNHVIREVQAATGNIFTVAGNGTPGFSGDGGLAISAQFAAGQSIALDGAGNLYIADSPNHRVRMVNSAGVMSTFAGNGGFGYAGDAGLAANATLYYPSGVAVDGIGNVFIADYGNGTVRMVSAASGIITTVAGNGITGYGNFPGEGGPASAATLGLPYAVTVDESGNLYIDDIGTSSIRKVGRDGIIRTIVSNVSTASLTTDPAGNLYFADYRNSVINKVLGDNTVITIAGSGTNGYAGDFGPAAVAQFNAPYGVAIDSSANIYVADYNNNVIRVLSPVAPPSAFVVNGASEAFSSVAPGEVISVFGNNIGSSTPAIAQPDANGIFETQFSGTMITFNGIPAPVLFSGPNYVSGVVPYALNGATAANVVVTQLGQTTGIASAPVAASAPGIFTAKSTGISGGLAVLNADGTVNAPTNAAAEASTITLFVTGEGLTTPAGVDGLVNAAGNTTTPLLPVTVTIGGSTAVVVSSIEAPGQVAGVLQMKVTLPAAVTTSRSVPVQVQVGGVMSQQVPIAVQ